MVKTILLSYNYIAKVIKYINRLIFYFHINHNWTLNCNFLSLKSPIPSIIINTVFRFIKPNHNCVAHFLPENLG